MMSKRTDALFTRVGDYAVAPPNRKRSSRTHEQFLLVEAEEG
jgi:hypothetical protein